jgi:hypothetical protein
MPLISSVHLAPQRCSVVEHANLATPCHTTGLTPTAFQACHRNSVSDGHCMRLDICIQHVCSKHVTLPALLIFASLSGSNATMA